MKKLSILLVCLWLTGCMSPYQNQNVGPPDEYIPVVQQAIDKYHKATGVLPIKNKSAQTPIYEKYPIDFQRLMGGYLSSIPDNAFENGGPFIYVLIDVNTAPKVRVMDLPSFQTVVDLQRKVDHYIYKNHSVPSGKKLYDHFFALDFKKIPVKPVQIRSDYSGNPVRLLISDKGKVVIDYAPDLMRLIQKSGKTPRDSHQDLRKLLVNGSPFVPIHSLPYYWKNNEPVITES